MRLTLVNLWLLLVVLSLVAASPQWSFGDDNADPWRSIGNYPWRSSGRNRTGDDWDRDPFKDLAGDDWDKAPSRGPAGDDWDNDPGSWEVIIPGGKNTMTTVRPWTTQTTTTTTSTTTPKATTTSTTTPKATTTSTTTPKATVTSSTTPKATTTSTTTPKAKTTELPQAPTEATTTTEPAEYEYYEEAQGSLKLHPATDWRAARLACLREGAELASPETPGLLAALGTALLAAAEEAYTGVNDLYSRGFFSSLRGTSLWDMPVRWAAEGGEGAGAGAGEGAEARCAVLRRDGELRARACGAELPFLCYKSKQPDPETECGTNREYRFSSRTNSCYKVHLAPATWGSAYAACRREGATLLVLSSEIEAFVMWDGFRKQATPIDQIHVGATRWEDGVWMTVQGETLRQAGFDKWDGSEGEEEASACAAARLRAGAGVQLRAHACREPLPFVCEKKPYL